MKYYSKLKKYSCKFVYWINFVHYQPFRLNLNGQMNYWCLALNGLLMLGIWEIWLAEKFAVWGSLPASFGPNLILTLLDVLSDFVLYCQHSIMFHILPKTSFDSNLIWTLSRSFLSIRLDFVQLIMWSVHSVASCESGIFQWVTEAHWRRQKH